MSITLRDLSKHTGVSLGTVSRYINGETVRDKTREKLEAAIKELGYTENIITKAKRTGSSMTIALVLSALNAEFVMKIVESLDNELSPHMFSLLLVNFHEDPVYLKKRLEELRHRKIDGLIFFPSGLEGDIASEIKNFLDSKIPVVAIDDFIHGIKTDAVVVDNTNSTFRATEYLIQQGHRRIGFLAGRKNSFVAQNRYDGCRKAFEAYDIPWDDSLLRWADFEMDKARQMFIELMNISEPPTAVFPTNYDMTMGTLLSIVNKNISIPEDLSLFGYDQFSGTEAFSPRLSLVVQPVEKIGKTAAEILLKRIRGNWDDFPKIAKLSTKMIIRDSVKKI